MTLPNIWGRQVIEKALAYANYQWTAHAENVLHGLDSDGRYVDTPNISWTGERLNCGWWKVDEVNVGIPYSWGNASTIEEFEAGIRNGKYAGNVPEDKKRYGSHNAVGVDCSGLLTICWELPKKIATRDIPAYASVVDRLDDIQQGDVFAKVGKAAVVFLSYCQGKRLLAHQQCKKPLCGLVFFSSFLPRSKVSNDPFKSFGIIARKRCKEYSLLLHAILVYFVQMGFFIYYTRILQIIQNSSLNLAIS